MRHERRQRDALAREAGRSSSMRTLFEFRGRVWFVRPLLCVAVGAASYFLVRLFLH